MMVATYEVKARKVGILEQEVVLSVDMPRKRFIQLVMDVLGLFEQRYGRDQAALLKEELLPVARQMPRFPMGIWVHPTRGCGCVVGEFLVATAELERAVLIESCLDTGGYHPIVSVDRLLSQRPDGSLLRDFGFEIDREMRDELERGGLDRYETQSVEIID